MTARRTTLYALCALLLAPAARAQDWTPAFDVFTAGAASYIVHQHLCYGLQRGQEASDIAVQRLVIHANDMAQYGVAPQAAYNYGREALRLKIAAMAQSNEGNSCRQLSRLREMAAGVGLFTQ